MSARHPPNLRLKWTATARALQRCGVMKLWETATEEIVFRRLRNTVRDGADMTWCGRLFQSMCNVNTAYIIHLLSHGLFIHTVISLADTKTTVVSNKHKTIRIPNNIITAHNTADGLQSDKIESTKNMTKLARQTAEDRDGKSMFIFQSAME